MTAGAAALRGQAAAGRLRPDSCTVVRPSSAAPTMNETTGALTYPAGTTVYSGACRVRSWSASLIEVQAEERKVSLVRWLVSLPVTAVDVEVGDVVTVTGSGDPSLVGRAFTVGEIARGATVTARRLLCTEVAS